MAYAMDLLIAALSVMVAVPLFMQLRRSLHFTRILDAEGLPVDPEWFWDKSFPHDRKDYQMVILPLACADGTEAEEDGWRLDVSERKLRHYFNGVFGMAMVLASVSLVFTLPRMGFYVAWAVLLGALVTLGLILPGFLRMFKERQFQPIFMVPVAIAAAAAAAGFRLL